MPVCVVDDDPSVCHSLDRLLRSAGHVVRTFGSPLDFLEFARVERAKCLVLDVCMPEVSGLEVQEGLVDSGIPIVVMSGKDDVPAAVRAMKAGAVDFLCKPFPPEALLDAVRRGIDANMARSRNLHASQALRDAYAKLTRRERDVLHCVIEGMLNKQIASALDITEKTVKVHRAHAMEKMGARSVAHLVKMAICLGIQTSSVY